MKKILFNGLGPNDLVTYDNNYYRNGSAVYMEDAHADCYIEAGIAIEIKTKADEEEIAKLQNLEIKNAKTRKRIEDKIKEGE